MAIERDRKEEQGFMSGLVRHGRVLGLAGLLTAFTQFGVLPRAGYTPYVHASAENLNRETEEDLRWQKALLDDIRSKLDIPALVKFTQKVMKDGADVLGPELKNDKGSMLFWEMGAANTIELFTNRFGEELIDARLNNVDREKEKGVCIGAAALVFPKKPGTGTPRILIQTPTYSQEEGIEDTWDIGTRSTHIIDVAGICEMLINAQMLSDLTGIEAGAFFDFVPRVKPSKPTDNLLGGSPRGTFTGAIGELMEKVKEEGSEAQVVLKDAKGKDIIIRPMKWDRSIYYRGIEVLYPFPKGK